MFVLYSMPRSIIKMAHECSSIRARLGALCMNDLLKEPSAKNPINLTTQSTKLISGANFVLYSSVIFLWKLVFWNIKKTEIWKYLNFLRHFYQLIVTTQSTKLISGAIVVVCSSVIFFIEVWLSVFKWYKKCWN